MRQLRYCLPRGVFAVTIGKVLGGTVVKGRKVDGMLALLGWRRLVAPVASVALSQAVYHACRIDGCAA